MVRWVFEHVFEAVVTATRGRRADRTVGADRGTTAQPVVFPAEDEYEYSHYTEALSEVERLRSEGRYDDLEALLRWCIDFAEAEQSTVADIGNFGDLPTVFYTDLAQLYRDAGRYEDEVAILERYVSIQESLGAPVESEVQTLYDRAQKHVSERIRQ
mgnify:CR=1 FL=1